MYTKHMDFHDFLQHYQDENHTQNHTNKSQTIVNRAVRQGEKYSSDPHDSAMTKSQIKNNTSTEFNLTQNHDLILLGKQDETEKKRGECLKALKSHLPQ